MTAARIPDGDRRPSPVGRVMERARYVATVPAVGMVLLSLVVVVWGVAKGIGAARDAFDPDTVDLDLVADLLKVTDLFLIGIVFLIVGLGLWELFVEDLDLPDWLTVTSLSGLKEKLIDTLLLVLGVYFVEQVLARSDPDDLLRLAGAIALVGGMLVLFRVLRPAKDRPATGDRYPEPVEQPRDPGPDDGVSDA